MSGMIQLDNSDCSYIKANVSNSHNDAVAFEMKFAKDITIAQLKVLICVHKQQKSKQLRSFLFHRANWKY